MRCEFIREPGGDGRKIVMLIDSSGLVRLAEA